jgi:glyoxylase-like metal-dependent hydrolase (beta-lactamase superfamily II)
MEKQGLHLGDWELIALRDAFFRLDGGSMFGVVPKPLWERKKPADELNRIRLGLNCLLVKSPDWVALIECGIGDKMTPKDEDRRGLERETGLPGELALEGLGPEDIDFVIPSHLHLDHFGWATVADGGAFRPTFKNASYIIQEREWRAALDPDRRSRSSYDKRDFQALEGHKGLRLVDGESRIVPGLEVYPTGGHTQGHQVVFLKSSGRTCVFTGDLLATTAHIKINWNMGWDLFPLDLMREKERLLKEAVEGDYLLFLTHEDGEPFLEARMIGSEL